MDIAGSKPHEFPSDAPWRAVQRRIDTKALVLDLLQKHPEAAPDEIAAMLARSGIQVNGMLIAHLVQEYRRKAGRGGSIHG
ncbi:MAG: hypothetical protein HUU20_27195 [Pirellulales bacterium]|nr:hypothetical protein [Pirellulales bacterium]